MFDISFTGSKATLRLRYVDDKMPRKNAFVDTLGPRDQSDVECSYAAEPLT